MLNVCARLFKFRQQGHGLMAGPPRWTTHMFRRYRANLIEIGVLLPIYSSNNRQTITSTTVDNCRNLPTLRLHTSEATSISGEGEPFQAHTIWPSRVLNGPLCTASPIDYAAAETWLLCIDTRDQWLSSCRCHARSNPRRKPIFRHLRRARGARRHTLHMVDPECH